MEDIRKERVVIDVGEVETSEELQVVLKEKLDFPDFYGENWDAFWDAITGLVELPETVIFENWGKLEHSLPEEARTLKKMLSNFNERHPSWKAKIEYV